MPSILLPIWRKRFLEAEFKKREGGVGSPTYNNVVADIEARVARTRSCAEVP